ncbi:MAG: PadR family transcriptional regulator [Acholeplasmataceae bacterium]|nr:PadR family transcriptional regulator [Acholeplasmataceae bacterium]
MNQDEHIKALMPLTETSFYVLITLYEPLHGYGIMQKVERLSHGRIRFGPGTLYGAIKNLQSLKLITLVSQFKEKSKKTYQITDLGKRLIHFEIQRLKDMVTHAEMLLVESEQTPLEGHNEEGNSKS